MNTKHNSDKSEKALRIGSVGNCADHQIRRCHHCNYKWAYPLSMTAQTNVCKCPNCGGMMSSIARDF